MKTSELKKWLDENFIKYREDEKYFELINSWAVQKNKKWLVFSNEISNELAEKIVEYYNTPISEREDEKKYRIELVEIRKDVLMKDEMRSTIYTMSLSSNEITIIFNKIFTQSEIDNFPKEIKGAIECGFLRKVEVL